MGADIPIPPTLLRPTVLFCDSRTLDLVQFSPDGEFIFFGRPKKTNQKKAAPQLAPHLFELRGSLRFSPTAAPANSRPAGAQTCAGSIRRRLRCSASLKGDPRAQTCRYTTVHKISSPDLCVSPARVPLGAQRKRTKRKPPHSLPRTLCALQKALDLALHPSRALAAFSVSSVSLCGEKLLILSGFRLLASSFSLGAQRKRTKRKAPHSLPRTSSRYGVPCASRRRRRPRTRALRALRHARAQSAAGCDARRR